MRHLYSRWLCGLGCKSMVESHVDGKLKALSECSETEEERRLPIVSEVNSRKNGSLAVEAKGEASSKEADDCLDEKIWSQLPDDLQERILSFVPVFKQLYLRCVCKRWNASLLSRSSYDLGPKTPEPWFVMFSKTSTDASVTALAYIPGSRKWHKLPSSFLPRTDDYIFHGTAGGLILYRARDDSSQTYNLFYVSNPLTGLLKEVPPSLLTCASRQAKLVVDEDGMNFRIYKLGKATSSNETQTDTPSNLALEVYESSTSAWRIVTKIDVGILAPHDLSVIASSSWPFSSNAQHGSFLYCEFCPLSEILAYDLQKNLWSKIAVPFGTVLTSPPKPRTPPGSYWNSSSAFHSCSICRSYSERQGRLLRVVRAVTREGNRRMSVRLQEMEHLDDCSEAGGDISTSNVCRDFLAKHKEKGIWCYAQGDLVFITAGKVHLLVHNLAEKTCHVAPPCPGITYNDSLLFDFIQTGFPFEPRLSALIPGP